MYLTYRYKLLPSKAQRVAFSLLLESQRNLYNECLSLKQMAWETCKASISYFDLCNWITRYKANNGLPQNINRHTLKRLDKSFSSFFRRCKSGDTPGYPRFKGANWFTSFGFVEFSGIRLKNGKLYFKGVGGGIKVQLHRPLPAGRKICSCTFKRSNNIWYVSFQIKVEDAKPLSIKSAVGIDVGLTHLVATSDGDKIDNIRPGKQLQAELRRKQRSLSRKVKGSNNRQKARLSTSKTYAKIANIRSTYLHQISAKLVKSYDLIAVEKLNVKGLCQSKLATHVNDAAWATLFHHLSYKASKAGKRVVEVDPRGTSQECSGCGREIRKDLSAREHSCHYCSLTLCRDVNAARVILHRAVASPGGLNHGVSCDGLRNVCSNVS